MRSCPGLRQTQFAEETKVLIYNTNQSYNTIKYHGHPGVIDTRAHLNTVLSELVVVFVAEFDNEGNDCFEMFSDSMSGLTRNRSQTLNVRPRR